MWLGKEDYVVLRAADGTVVSGNDADQKSLDTRNPAVGVMVQNAMQTYIVPDLQFIREHLPEVWARILADGVLHICIGADNHSRQKFNGKSMKSEVCMIKIILPVTNSAQQACCLAMPVFMHEGVCLASMTMLTTRSALLSRKPNLYLLSSCDLVLVQVMRHINH